MTRTTSARTNPRRHLALPNDSGTNDSGTNDSGTDDSGTNDSGTDDFGTDDSGTDDTGAAVALPRTVRRVVSLVPSLTESFALSAPGLLVGATRYCTHPAELDVPRVGGTKNPDVEAVLALRPDLVVANEEENRAADLARLRSAGVAVWVTRPRSVPGAIASLTRMLAAAGVPRPSWLAEAQRAWSPPKLPAPRGQTRALVCIWRRPWMGLGRDTFAGDVLARLGYPHVYADDTERYPRIDLAEAGTRDVELVVLPDEPYQFSVYDGPEAFGSWGVPVALVSGRYLTWYGPALVAAPAVLRAELAAATRPEDPGHPVPGVTGPASPGAASPGRRPRTARRGEPDRPDSPHRPRRPHGPGAPGR